MLLVLEKIMNSLAVMTKKCENKYIINIYAMRKQDQRIFAGIKYYVTLIIMVQGAGIEPAWIAPYAPQTYVSTNSTTPASFLKNTSSTICEIVSYLPTGFQGCSGFSYSGKLFK